MGTPHATGKQDIVGAPKLTLRAPTLNFRPTLFCSDINIGSTIGPQLGFADEIVFFYSAYRKSFLTIKEILDEFSDFKRRKSFATFSNKVQDGVDLVGILGFEVKSLLIKYLGTSLIGKSIFSKDCDYHLQAILARWNQ